MNKENIETILELTPMQQGMLYHSLYTDRENPYVYQYTSRLRGRLIPASFNRAWQRVVERHQVLRASYFWKELDKPLQVIGRKVDLPFFQHDWRHLGIAEQEKQLDAFLKEDRERGFDLGQAPLMRLSLIQLADQVQELVWSFHHILLDGWSVPLLLQEVFGYYEAFSQRKELRLPPPRSFGDFIAWLQKQDVGKAESFWRQTLAGVAAPTQLPFDGKDIGVIKPEIGYAAEEVRLPEKTTSGLSDLARRQRLTTGALIQGTWALLLSRYSGRKDVVFGTVVSGRPPELDGAESMVGLFINTLPTRARVEVRAAAIEWLRGFQTEQAEGRRYEYSPLALVQGWSDVERGTPLFESIVAFENFPTGRVSMEGSEKLEVVSARSIEGNNYPLALIVQPEAALGLMIAYNTHRFTQPNIQRLLRELREALEKILADPMQSLAQLMPGLEASLASGQGPESGKLSEAYERSNLTPFQFAFWMGQKLQPKSPLFNMASLLFIPRAVDGKRFRRAFQVLVNSSDALRTVFEEIDGLPQQKVLPRLDCELEILDLSAEDDPLAACHLWADERCRRPFRLEERLFDAALIKLGAASYAWYLNYHQLASDAWSYGLISRRVFDLYSRVESQVESERVEFPQFQAFLAHERELRRSPRFAKAGLYWQKKLAERPKPIEFYGVAPPAMTTVVKRLRYKVDAERSAKLKALAAGADLATAWPELSLFSVFTALLFTYLYRISGEPRRVIGTPLHNRSSAAFKETIGMCMQVVPLEVEIGPDETFASLVRKIAGEFFEVARYSNYPIRNTLNEKVYDVFLNFHNFALPSFMDAHCDSIWLHPGAGNEALTLQVHDFDQTGCFDLDFDLDCEVFSPEQQEKVIEHFLQVMDGFLANYRQPLREISLLTPAETERIVRVFNRTETAFPTDKIYPLLFELQAGRTPNRIAMTYEDQSITYSELNAGANRLARFLRGQGASPEDVIALLARRGPELLTAILGVMKAGAAYLPIDPIDPSKRQAQLLAQSRSRFALVSAEFRPALGEAIDALEGGAEASLWPIETKHFALYDSSDLPPVSKPKNLAYVIYTSGSTGSPKGVMIEQEGMINHIHAKLRDTQMTNDDTLAQIASQCFDSSVWQFLGPLLNGGRVSILNDEQTHDPIALLDRVERDEVTVLSTVPSMLRAMLEAVRLSEPGRWPLSRLRVLLEMGEALPADLCREWMLLYPRQYVINAYGLTECSDDVTHYVVPGSPAPDQVRVPIGGPIANTTFYVLDPMRQPTPVGVVGELCVGGVGVGRGYLYDREKSADKFIPDPFSKTSGARLYRSGDLARYFADGNLDYLGRMDFQVKVRGFRIEFGEIEAALRQHPGVLESVASAVDAGKGDKKLVAYVTPAGGQSLDLNEVRNFVKEHLPDYMVPALMVKLDALPLNANGKVDRKALPLPDLSKLRSESERVAPRNPWELQLAYIWQDLLGLEGVGVTDNFFELGGHSLLAVRMLAQIRRRIGQEIPLASLIEAGTIERLANLLMEKSSRQPSPIVPINPEGSSFPLFCLHPGGGNVLCYLPLAEYLDPEQPVLGVQDPAVFELNDQHEAEDLYVPLEEMAARYIRAIQSVQAEGPYLLCGWSFGGFVAYEIAQQLTALGQQVALLAVFDTGPVYETLGQRDDADLLAALCEESGLDISVSDLRKLSSGEQLEFVSRRLKKMGVVSLDIPTSWIKRSVNIFKTRIRTVMNYQLKPYPGAITLFRAVEQDATDRTDRTADPTLGWSRYSPQTVEVITTPGNHATMGQEPHVKILSQRLQEAIRRKTENIAPRPASAINRTWKTALVENKAVARLRRFLKLKKSSNLRHFWKSSAAPGSK